MTQEDFINKSKAVYGNRYDYSKTEFNGWENKVVVFDNYTEKEKWINPKHLLYKDKRYTRLTKKERADIFIKKSKEKFGDKFDYSKVRYVDSQTPVTLICKEHGEFDVNIYRHLQSKDGFCQLSADKGEFKRGGTKHLSTDYIIKRCQYIYGDKYDYSNVKYKGGSSKTEMVEIICPIHGSFFKKYENINKRDCGCPKCAKERTKEKKRLNDIISNSKKFIEKSRNRFGDKFVYSKVEYVNSHTPVILICKEHGIEFSITPSNHFNCKFGGCKVCYEQYIESTRSKNIKPKLTKEERKERRTEYKKNRFIEKAINKFGDRYDYSKVEYIDGNTLVNIIDKESDNEIFSIKPYSFLHSAHGRPNDNKIKVKKFIERAKKIHGNKYNYSKVKYKCDKEKVCIICPIHGEFWQTPHNHSSIAKGGCGCPKCSNAVSKLEECVINRLTKENIKFKKEYINKKIFGDMRGDFFIKSHNIMIECQGSQHFEENNNLHNAYGGSLSGQIERDYNFNKCCKDANISLFYYFDKKNAKGADYLNDKKFKGIYTEKNTFTDIDSLMSCIISRQ